MPNLMLHVWTRVLLGVAVLAVSAGCGGDEPPTPPVTNPPNTGATCEDDTGDLSRSAGETGGNLTEPAGVDLTNAEARVADSILKVSFTTAGPIAGAPNPEFRMAQGTAGKTESFELVATPPERPATAGTVVGDTGAPWELRLVTFRPDARGGIAEAPRSLLRVPVTVEGNRLSYEVPLRDLPAISTYIWLFGASATSPDGQDTVLDDCDHYGGGATVPPTPAPPTTVAAAGASGAVGDTLTYKTGSQVTVYAVEPGPAVAGTVNVALDVKVCAPASASVEARRDFFSISTTDDRSYPAAEVAGARQPALPEAIVLEPGACRRAWTTVPVPGTARPATARYSPETSGAGALTWRLP